MIEIEMGNRGSKSDRGYIENIYMGSVKEQRVDGSSAARYNI